MMLTGVLLHLAFFLFGYIVFKNVKLLQTYHAHNIHLDNGIFLFSIVCSLLVLTIWLIILFRHNSFKNFYPTSRWQLFGSFVIYFLIFLVNSSYYLSYKAGFTIYINQHYPNAKIESEINTANLAAAFLSYSQSDYTIDKKKYPAPFDSLYCETNEDEIDFKQPFLQRFNDEYQFYTVKWKTMPRHKVNEYITVPNGVVFQKSISDSVIMYAYKDQVVDMSPLTGTELSYLNYSNIYFEEPDAGFDHYDISVNSTRTTGNSIKRFSMNRKIYNLLKENDPQKLKQLFVSFLKIVEEYKIETNLTAQKWIDLVHNKNFLIEKFIRREKRIEQPTDYVTSEDDYSEGSQDRDTEENRNKKLKYYKDRLTDFYLDADILKMSFDNISNIKHDSQWSLITSVHSWLAFALALVLFMFRTSGLPAILFSAISVTLLAILVVLFISGMGMRGDLSIAYFVFTLSTVILVTPLLLLEKIRKRIQIIFINITLAGIVPYMLLILFIINTHQESYYKKLLGDEYYKKMPPLLFNQIGDHLHWLMLFAGFVFIAFYTPVIKKWRSLPED